MSKAKEPIYTDADIAQKIKETGLTEWYLEDGWLRRKYTTDGTAMAFESQGTQVTSSAVWEGNTLIVVSKVTAIGVQFTDKMTLSEDGNTLTSAVRIDSAQGGVDLKVVFDRK